MRSIQRQLTLWLALACCGLWVLGSLAVYLALRGGLIAEFDRANLIDVYSLTNLTEQSEAGLKFDATGEFLPTFQRENRPDYFQLWETDGAILYRSPTLLDPARSAEEIRQPERTHGLEPDSARWFTRPRPRGALLV